MINSLFLNKALAVLVAFSFLAGLCTANIGRKPGEPGLGPWEQCGGVDKDGNEWSGETTCQTNLQCFSVNKFFSQCRPVAPPAMITPAPTPFRSIPSWSIHKTHSEYPTISSKKSNESQSRPILDTTPLLRNLVWACCTTLGWWSFRLGTEVNGSRQSESLLKPKPSAQNGWKIWDAEKGKWED